MALSLQSFCPTTAKKLKTVHKDYDVEAHFTLKRNDSKEEFGKHFFNDWLVPMIKYGIVLFCSIECDPWNSVCGLSHMILIQYGQTL